MFQNTTISCYQPNACKYIFIKDDSISENDENMLKDKECLMEEINKIINSQVDIPDEEDEIIENNEKINKKNKSILIHILIIIIFIVILVAAIVIIKYYIQKRKNQNENGMSSSNLIEQRIVVSESILIHSNNSISLHNKDELSCSKK